MPAKHPLYHAPQSRFPVPAKQPCKNLARARRQHGQHISTFYQKYAPAPAQRLPAHNSSALAVWKGTEFWDRLSLSYVVYLLVANATDNEEKVEQVASPLG